MAWPGRRRPGKKVALTAEDAKDAEKKEGGSPEEVGGRRRLLYWRPVLAMTAHMILAVAVKLD